MTELFSDGTLRVVGLALVQFVWQGALIAAVVAGALTLLRHASPNARYMVACLGLAAMVAAPILTLTVSSPRPAHGVQWGTATVSGSDGSVHVVPLTFPRPEPNENFGGYLGIGPGQVEAGLPVIAAAWTLGVFFLTLRLLSGWLTVRTIRRGVVLLVPAGWTEKTASITRALGIARRVTIGISEAVDVPTVIGWLRPMVLVPASTFAGLSPFQFEAILAHELAHVRRHDYLINVLQNAAETLLFYHPAVWWLSNRVRAEREHCCDDVAVEFCGDRVAYAGALASLESLRLRAPILAVAANSGDLLTRIRRVLAVPVEETRSPSAAVAIIAAALLAGPLVGTATQGALEAASPAKAVTSAPSPARDSVSRIVDEMRGQEPAVVVRAVEAPASTAASARAREVAISQRQAALEQYRVQQDLAEASRRLEERSRNLPAQRRDAEVLALLTDQLTARAAEPISPTIAAMEEQLRLARVNKDAATLSGLLDTAFTGTDSAGATLNRVQALNAFQVSPIQSVTIQLTSSSMVGKTAFTTGVQTEITSVGQAQVQFTRVWTNTASGWRLLQSVEFRPIAGVEENVVRIPNQGTRFQPTSEMYRALGLTPPAPGAAAAPVFQQGPVVRVGGDVKEPRLLTPNIRPVYPAVAKDAFIQGLVIIEATIDETGHVTNARVIKPAHGSLDQAALDAVRQWRYSPTLLAGTPVSVLLNVSVNFALQ